MRNSVVDASARRVPLLWFTMAFVCLLEIINRNLKRKKPDMGHMVVNRANL